jgi:hypothetical protein
MEEITKTTFRIYNIINVIFYILEHFKHLSIYSCTLLLENGIMIELLCVVWLTYQKKKKECLGRTLCSSQNHLGW